nr:MAG TPA: hypothetical protein [Caudoviricetes sp.]
MTLFDTAQLLTFIQFSKKKSKKVQFSAAKGLTITG